MRWAILVPLGAVTVALEAAGAAAIFGLIRVLTDPMQAARMPIVAPIVAGLPERDPANVIVVLAVGVGLLYLVKNGLAAVTTHLRERCVETSAAALATTLLRRYLEAPYAFHLRRNSVDLVHDATQAVQRVFGGVLAPALALVTEVFRGRHHRRAARGRPARHPGHEGCLAGPYALSCASPAAAR
jgi:hypothetical protein